MGRLRRIETTWVLGQADPPLNETGIRQACEAATVLKRRGISAIFSSDLRRAIQTAQAISDAVGCAIQVDTQLREASFGVLEGRSINELMRSGIWQRRKSNMYAFRPEGGESYEDVEPRIYRFIDMNQANLHDAAVVTHVGVLRVFAALAGFCLREQVAEFIATPGSCWRVEITAHGMSHLTGLLGAASGGDL